MAESTPPAPRRLSLALAAFWRILVDPAFASGVAAAVIRAAPAPPSRPTGSC